MRQKIRLSRAVMAVLLAPCLFLAGCGESNEELRNKSANNLKQIGLALHGYCNVWRKLPPPAICDKEGKPLLSWRVAILPYIEQAALYNSFKLDEPWDSPHNLPLSKTVIAIYQTPGVRTSEPHLTHYKVFASRPGARPSSMFIENEVSGLTGVGDGLSNTLMVVESGDPVPWAKPDDIPFDPTAPVPTLASPRKDGMIGAAFGDTSVKFLREKTPSETLCALITANGGEAFDLSEAEAK